MKELGLDAKDFKAGMLLVALNTMLAIGTHVLLAAFCAVLIFIIAVTGRAVTVNKRIKDGYKP